MKITNYKCQTCGKDKTRISFSDEILCKKGICCKCCEKQGLQPTECKIAQLELERFSAGKQLNKNDVKGLLLEKSVSDTLHILKIPHNHNPFNNTYPCYQIKRPDITIQKLDILIECKNLSKKQVDHLSKEWLDENMINRPNVTKYRRKIALFSFGPRKSLVRHLNKYGWRVYGLGTQILTLKQCRKETGNLIKKFYWIKKKYYKNKSPKSKEQTRLKLAECLPTI